MTLKMNTLLRAILLSSGAVIFATSSSADTKSTPDMQEIQRRVDVCRNADSWLQEACFDAVFQSKSKKPASRLVPLDVAAPEAADKNDLSADVGAVDEMHLVGIYEPRETRNESGRISRGTVRVAVDRPGKKVALVLTSYEAVKWDVQLTAHTELSGIFYGGHGAKRTSVTVNGDEYQARQADLPLAYKMEGSRFQPLHAAARKLVDVERASSFSGSYYAPSSGFVIAEAPGVKTATDMQEDLAQSAVETSSLSEKFRAALGSNASAALRFAGNGFTGSTPDGRSISAPLPLDMPSVSWPSGTAYDPEGQRLWAISFGGEGVLYRYDIADNAWAAWSMNNVDASGLLYDADGDRLIAGPGLTGSAFRIMNVEGRVLRSVDVPTESFPGLVSTYDPGNGPSPSFDILAIEGDKLLVQSKSRFGSPLRGSKSMTYIIDLRSGKATLVQ